jgi:imidazoleglycerol-phosphate dehydratase
MRSFSDHARATLHLRVLRGLDRHHVVEAAFKSLGLALRDALAEGDGVFSTKGRVETAVGARAVSSS